jgi:hypothetical protein
LIKVGLWSDNFNQSYYIFFSPSDRPAKLFGIILEAAVEAKNSLVVQKLKFQLKSIKNSSYNYEFLRRFSADTLLYIRQIEGDFDAMISKIC